MTMDFKEQLIGQLDFIQASCDRYDAGHRREAVRIATAVRVICHQSSGSTSLLTHLKANDVHLLSTADIPNPGQPFFPAITKVTLDPANLRVEYTPKLEVAYARQVLFNLWWCTEVIYRFPRPPKTPKEFAAAKKKKRPEMIRVELTRKHLVLGAANKDGGAHVDTHLDLEYEEVLDGMGFSMTVSPTPEQSHFVPSKHGHLSALRQIGYELINSSGLSALTV